MLKILLQASLSKSRKFRSLVEAARAAVLMKSPVVLVSPTVPARSNRLCVFAHYDCLRRVDEHVFHHLKALQTLGTDVVFVTSSGGLHETDCQRLLAICNKVILRDNFGYDFGSFRAGLMEMTRDRAYEQFILVNDSVYGPFHDLSRIFDSMSQRPADIWSITDSYEHEYHLQSYFIVFNRRTWERQLFREFWTKFLHIKSKRGAIHLYEIGLSRVAKKAGLVLDAWCDTARVYEIVLKGAAAKLASATKETPLDEIEKRRLTQLMDVSLGAPCNITHMYWDYLIRDFGCPYLKVELLRNNPLRVLNIAFYRDLLNGSYPHDLISNHLRRSPG